MEKSKANSKITSKTEIEVAGIDRNAFINGASETDLDKLAAKLDELPQKSVSGSGISLQLASYEGLQEYQELLDSCNKVKAHRNKIRKSNEDKIYRALVSVGLLDEWVSGNEFPLKFDQKEKILDKIVDAEEDLIEVDISNSRQVNSVYFIAEKIKKEIDDMIKVNPPKENRLWLSRSVDESMPLFYGTASPNTLLGG